MDAGEGEQGRPVTLEWDTQQPRPEDARQPAEVPERIASPSRAELRSRGTCCSPALLSFFDFSTLSFVSQ